MNGTVRHIKALFEPGKYRAKMEFREYDTARHKKSRVATAWKSYIMEAGGIEPVTKPRFYAGFGRIGSASYVSIHNHAQSRVETWLQEHDR